MIARLIIVLVMLGVWGCTLMNPWARAGFSKDEQNEWKLLRVDLVSAEKWRSIGCSPAHAYQWKRSGNSLNGAIYWKHEPYVTAANWHEAGFNTEAALDWIFSTSTVKKYSRELINPISPNEALDWAKAGFTPQETRPWRDVPIIPTEAQEWKRRGFKPSEASDWISNGFSTTNSLPWHAAGFGADEAKECRDRHMTVEDAQRWKQAGVSIHAATDWIAKGFSLAEALDWSSFDANTAQEWRECDFKPQEAQEWSSAGIGAIMTRRWLRAGYSLPMARQWKESGIFDVSEADTWRKAGFTNQDTKQWKEKGFTPEKARKMQRICPHGIHDLFALLKTNPYETAGSCYIVGGGQLQLLSRTEALFEIFGTPFLIDFGKRSVPGTFYQGVVKGLGAYRYIDALGRLRTVPRVTPALPAN
jgi:hypothetical protein